MTKKIYKGLSSYLQDMGRPINFYPSLVKAFGNRNVAIFIGQMGYWRDRITDKEGRIYKTAEEIEEETSLTYKEQRFVRKFLKKKGILTEKYYRSIHRLYFKINWQKVDEIWEKYLSQKDSTCPAVNCHLPQSKFVNRNTETTTDINIPAIAGDKLCECKGDEMCDKCEQTKRRIETDKEYGFDYDKKIAEKWLTELEQKHKFEEGKETSQPESTEQRILGMLSGHNEYSEKVSEYPEQVQSAVMMFAKTFRLSFSAIPKKSKGKGGMYATWIKGIQDLQSIAGNERRFKLVLDKVFEVWNNRDSEFKTHVDMPQKIRGAFVTMESELRGEEETREKEIAENIKNAKIEKEVYITDNPEKAKSAVADLKKQMRRYDSENKQ